MKITIGVFIKMTVLFTILLCIVNADAQTNRDHVRVDGYYRKDGTYVRPHYRTKGNETVNDNFSTLGNVNPYTGELGWMPREPSFIFDSNIHRGIPKEFIYPSVEILRLEITNHLNKYTDFLNQNVKDSDVGKLYWTLDNESIATFISPGIWKVYAEEYYLDLLLLYFDGIRALLERSGYLEFMYHSGIKKIKIKTNEYTIEYLVAELLGELKLNK